MVTVAAQNILAALQQPAMENDVSLQSGYALRYFLTFAVKLYLIPIKILS